MAVVTGSLAVYLAKISEFPRSVPEKQYCENSAHSTFVEVVLFVCFRNAKENNSLTVFFIFQNLPIHQCRKTLCQYKDVCFLVLKVNKTTSHNRQIFCRLTHLKISFRKMKAFFFEKTLSSADFDKFFKFEFFLFLQKKPEFRWKKTFSRNNVNSILILQQIGHFERF